MFIFLYLYHFLFDNYIEGVIKGTTSSDFRCLWMAYEEPPLSTAFMHSLPITYYLMFGDGGGEKITTMGYGL